MEVWKSLKIAIDFDKSMSHVLETMNVSDKSFKEIARKARKLGENMKDR